MWIACFQTTHSCRPMSVGEMMSRRAAMGQAHDRHTLGLERQRQPRLVAALIMTALSSICQRDSAFVFLQAWELSAHRWCSHRRFQRRLCLSSRCSGPCVQEAKVRAFVLSGRFHCVQSLLSYCHSNGCSRSNLQTSLSTLYGCGWPPESPHQKACKTRHMAALGAWACRMKQKREVPAHHFCGSKSAPLA